MGNKIILFILAFLLLSCEKNESSDDPQGPYVHKNQSILDEMNKTYLWNEEISNVPIDLSLNCEDFLRSLLDGVASQNDVNKEDGYVHIVDGVTTRRYYTWIVIDDPNSKASNSVRYGVGIGCGKPAFDPSTGDVITYILYVTPGSPAAQDGLVRGSIITKFGGITFKELNQDFHDKHNYIGTRVKTIEVGDPVIDASNNLISVINKRTVSLRAEEYTVPADSPIAKHKVISLDNNSKRVGYLKYDDFDANFDRELIKISAGWKAQNVNEVVLDFRNNSGGSAATAALLGTTIAGKAHFNKMFLKTMPNKNLMSNNYQTDYRIGSPLIPHGVVNANYTAMTDALNESLSGINVVYVLTSDVTASASEVLINGLRGLDIEVRLIGLKTRGKNVGSSAYRASFEGGVDIILYAIEFYSYNGKGFKDFYGGFEPQVHVDEEDFVVPFEHGNPSEILLKTALEWISTGVKPIVRKPSNPSMTHLPANKTLSRLDFLYGYGDDLD